MKIVVDTNVLIRCSRGRAMDAIVLLRKHDVVPVTTHHHAAECTSVLIRVFAMPAEAALGETRSILRPFEMVAETTYEPWRREAELRLDQGGKSDWPGLAAALALDIPLWSDDRDFFGTGIPVWATRNLSRLIQSTGASLG